MHQLYTAFGCTMTLGQWVKSHLNVWHFSLQFIFDRLRHDYTLEQALSLPKGVHRDTRMSRVNLKRLLAFAPHLTRKQQAALSGWKIEDIRNIQ
jgi:hypothetical protein